jgi:hypothetical protein
VWRASSSSLFQLQFTVDAHPGATAVTSLLLEQHSLTAQTSTATALQQRQPITLLTGGSDGAVRHWWLPAPARTAAVAVAVDELLSSAAASVTTAATKRRYTLVGEYRCPAEPSSHRRDWCQEVSPLHPTR